MKNLFAFIGKHSFILLFFLLQIVSFVLIVNCNEPQGERFAIVSNAIRGRVHQVTEAISKYFFLEQANNRLAKENAWLYSVQGFSLKSNEVVPTYVYDPACEQEYEYFPAKVLNNSINNTNNYLTLDKGWKHGVQKNMSVISPMGIVGVVVQVSKNFSLVMTTISSQFRVSAKLKNSGFYGSLTWDGADYQIVTLDEIPLHAIISVGDTVVTNTYSNLFPSEIPIGVVKSYYQNGNFFSADIKLSTDFKHLEYVYIVHDLMKKERQNLEEMVN